jgi:hypothetical protein
LPMRSAATLPATSLSRPAINPPMPGTFDIGGRYRRGRY